MLLFLAITAVTTMEVVGDDVFMKVCMFLSLLFTMTMNSLISLIFSSIYCFSLAVNPVNTQMHEVISHFKENIDK